MYFKSSILLAFSAVLPLLAQGATGSERAAGTAAVVDYSPYANRDFPSDVYFGDVHVHTALSADAGGAGNKLIPRDAYRFARGEQVTASSGQPVKLGTPYDFLAVADHSDGMGMITDVLAGAPHIMADPYGRELNAEFTKGGRAAANAMAGMIARFAQGKMPEALNYQPGNPAYRSAWEDIVAAAEEFNNPGVFTTFIGYEWTSLVAGDNLHRVVLYRDGAEKALMVEPYTTTPPVGSPNPRDLWAWMENYEDRSGGQILAIPHNGNLSNGAMFPLVDRFNGNVPLDAAYARSRMRWEPLAEVTQPKGDGETHPVLSPDDPFADYETWDAGNLDLSEAKTVDMLAGEYARSGLKRGLEMAVETGANPYRFGMIGSSDIHTSLSTPEEDNFFGKTTPDEPSPNRAAQLVKKNDSLGIYRYGWEYATPGVAAVWARENTREAIFDAMMRKETYATTGTRIRVRFFGGRGFVAEDAQRRDLAQIGYAKGVPMGGDLPPGEGAPSFLVYAMRDPKGANLDRIQIVKGWVNGDGEAQEKVFDVALSDGRTSGSEAVGDTTDLSLPSWTNTIGAMELGTVWTDPNFDPAQSAFYYARVIEIPTPRWTAYDAVKFGLELPDEVPMTVQERAYTSPIWFRSE